MLRCQSVVTAPAERQHPKQRPQAPSATAVAVTVPVPERQWATRPSHPPPSCFVSFSAAKPSLAPTLVPTSWQGEPKGFLVVLLVQQAHLHDCR